MWGAPAGLGAAPGWMSEWGPELISHLGSSCGSCSAVELGMCRTPVCQGWNLGAGSWFWGDGGRALPADGAPRSALGSGKGEE